MCVWSLWSGLLRKFWQSRWIFLHRFCYPLLQKVFPKDGYLKQKICTFPTWYRYCTCYYWNWLTLPTCFDLFFSVHVWYFLGLIHTGFCHCLVPRIKCCFTDKNVFLSCLVLLLCVQVGAFRFFFFFLVSFNDECVLCLWSALLIVSMVQVRTYTVL